MDLFDYLIIKSDSFFDSAPPPQILGSSGPHDQCTVFSTYESSILKHYLVLFPTHSIFPDIPISFTARG